jgi:capsule polysaccharide export protein KpsE/RkpR
MGTRPKLEELAPLPVEEVNGEDVSVQVLHEKAVGQLRIVWDKRRFLVQAFLAGLVIGCLVAFLIPSRYVSTVQLMPPDNQSTSGLAMLAALASKGGGAAGGVAGDLLGIKTSGALFIGVLSSRTVQDRLVDRFQLKKVYHKSLQEDARTKLAENTGVSEDRKSGIIEISVTDHSPQLAAAIAQAYVEELNQLVAELSTSAAHRERVFLEERLVAVKKDLDDASVKFSQFSSKNTAIDIKEQGRAMVDAASRLQGELIAAQSELMGLEQIYTASNVRVRSLQARISELQLQLRKLGGKADAGPNAAPTSSDSLYPSIRELPVLGVTYADLYRRIRVQEAVFETLTQQYELAKVQEVKETPSVKVLDDARVPEKKSFPPRTLLTGLGGFVFLGIAVAVVLLRVGWKEMDSKDPGKLFAGEVFNTVHGYLPWTAHNGTSTQPEDPIRKGSNQGSDLNSELKSGPGKNR